MAEKKPLFSETISFLRFPLAFLVVMIHNNPLGIQTLFTDNDPSFYANYPIYMHIYHAITDSVARLAVPLFFFFSGFLFFLKFVKNREQKQVITPTGYYWGKIKKSINSLVITYFVWNLIFIAFTFLIQVFLKNHLQGNQLLYEDYKLMDWLKLIWYPTDSPLWFIRDLFIVNICSLPLYYILKNRYTGLIIIAALLCKWFFLDKWFWGLMECDSFLFFSIGAYMCIHGRDFTKYRRIISKPALSIYLILIFVEAYIWANGSPFTYRLEQLMILIGMCMAVSCASIYIENPEHKWNRNLAKTSFFIYVLHNMPLVIILRVYGMLVPQNEWTLLLGFVVFPIITIAIVLIVFKFMEQKTPKLFGVLNGNR